MILQRGDSLEALLASVRVYAIELSLLAANEERTDGLGDAGDDLRWGSGAVREVTSSSSPARTP